MSRPTGDESEETPIGERLLASADLALQFPTCGADPPPWMGSEGSQSELLRTGERTQQRPLTECLVRLTRRVKKEGGKRGVILVFYGVMEPTKAADGMIDSWTFGRVGFLPLHSFRKARWQVSVVTMEATQTRALLLAPFPCLEPSSASTGGLGIYRETSSGLFP